MAKIYGVNLGNKEAEYKPLSDRFGKKSDKVKRIVLNIEKMYESAKNKTNEIPVKPMKIKDGLVDIRGGLLHHRCTSQIEGLEGIAQRGVLASEWFGFVESEREAILCAFLSRWNTEEQERKFKIVGSNSNKQKLGGIDRNSVILFFDESHPAMKSLVHMDYFEYEKVKAIDSEKLSEYTPEQKEVLDFIEANSRDSAKKFHLDETDSKINWLAIPGGIPSKLINGVCVRGMKCNDDYIKKLHELFPNATIFNGSIQVLYNPELLQFTTIEELKTNVMQVDNTSEKNDDEELQL